MTQFPEADHLNWHVRAELLELLRREEDRGTLSVGSREKLIPQTRKAATSSDGFQ